MGRVVVHLCLGPDVDRRPCGFLPKMATTSHGPVGALPACSFPGRANSVGNRVLTKGNSLLGPDDIDTVAVLRMNRAFVVYIRQDHPEVPQQHFNVTLLKPGDNEEVDSGEEEEEEEEPDKEKEGGPDVAV